MDEMLSAWLLLEERLRTLSLMLPVAGFMTTVEGAEVINLENVV